MSLKNSTTTGVITPSHIGIDLGPSTVDTEPVRKKFKLIPWNVFLSFKEAYVKGMQTFDTSEKF